jgi:tRNA-specific 2-thiouridylase
VYSGIAPKSEDFVMKLSAKLRYAAPPVPATVVFSGDQAQIVLDEPHRAVTPGQSCVLYDGDVLVAGGFIDRSE